MNTRLRQVVRRSATVLAAAVGATLLSAIAVSAATTFGTSSITTTGTLQVDGNSTFDTNTLFVDATNNKVGIGTVTPGSPLHVVQSAANSQILELTRPQASTDQGGYLFFRGGASGTVVRGYFGFTQTGGSPTPTILSGSLDNAMALRSEGPVQFGSGGDSIRMTITSAGFVGIGVANPAYELQVASARTDGTVIGVKNTDTGGRGYGLLSSGSVSAGGAGNLYVYDDVAGIRMTVTSAGNVGVGDNTPAALFTVGNGDLFQVNGSGNVSTTGTLGVASSVANSDKLVLVANASGSTAATGTLTTADLSVGQTWTLPNASGTLVLEGTTATLLNKTLTSPLVSATNVSSTSLAVKALATQTANLQEWQDSSGIALSSVGANGAVSAASLSVGGGTAITKHLSATGVVGNAGTALTSLACIGDAVTVSGAATGDSVVATPTQALEGNIMWSAYVSGSNTVTVTLCNPTGNPVSVNDRTWRVDVWKH